MNGKILYWVVFQFIFYIGLIALAETEGINTNFKV